MSLLDASCIRVIAESVGIAQVSDEVAEALAPDVEYRLRDIVQACSRSVVRERASLRKMAALPQRPTQRPRAPRTSVVCGSFRECGTTTRD